MGFGASASSRRVVVLAGVLLLAVVFWLWRSGRRHPPDVVLITVDTLRADHLGCYGSRTTSTPNIDRLAAEGAVFEHAASPLPETRPAHFTLFTSRYPRDHGVLSNASPLPVDAVTLPEIFAAAGYRTAGFAGCALFDAESGAGMGFAAFDAPEMPQRSAREVVPLAIRWLESLEKNERFFLWLHLFDPHMPYQPPPPFNARGTAEMVEAWPELAWPEMLESADLNGGDLSREIFDRALGLYAGEVEYVDHWLGRFFDALAALGRWDRTAVVLTADHGECFSKGVFFDHSQCLNDGAIAVPLILRYPPEIAGGQRFAGQAEHLDIGPALLRLSGLPVPEEFLGRDLLVRAAAAEDSYAFFQHPFYRRFDVSSRQEVLDRLRSVAGEPTRMIVGDQLQIGVQSGAWKYLRRGADEALYNLAEDPRESDDLAAREGERLERFRNAARRWMREHPVKLVEGAEVDPDLIERLKALGYL